MGGVFRKELPAQSTVESVRKQLPSVRTEVGRYRQRLPLYTERFTEEVNDGFSEFQYSLRTEVRRVVEKRRKDTETSFKTDLEAIGTSLCSIDGNLSRPKPSS